MRKLQRQLEIALEALREVSPYGFNPSGGIASKALAEIKKEGELADADLLRQQAETQLASDIEDCFEQLNVKSISELVSKHEAERDQLAREVERFREQLTIAEQIIDNQIAEHAALWGKLREAVEQIDCSIGKVPDRYKPQHLRLCTRCNVLALINSLTPEAVAVGSAQD